jgi:protein-disulfide isomerase-like protein with CxxC motif
MLNKIICRWCGGEGHVIEDCPQRKPKAIPVRQNSLTKTKGKWVKPEIRRYVRVDCLTGSPFVQEDVNEKFDKTAYQRDYMRKRRGKG